MFIESTAFIILEFWELNIIFVCGRNRLFVGYSKCLLQVNLSKYFFEKREFNDVVFQITKENRRCKRKDHSSEGDACEYNCFIMLINIVSHFKCIHFDCQSKLFQHRWQPYHSFGVSLFNNYQMLLTYLRSLFTTLGFCGVFPLSPSLEGRRHRINQISQQLLSLLLSVTILPCSSCPPSIDPCSSYPHQSTHAAAALHQSTHTAATLHQSTYAATALHQSTHSAAALHQSTYAATVSPPPPPLFPILPPLPPYLFLNLTPPPPHQSTYASAAPFNAPIQQLPPKIL